MEAKGQEHDQYECIMLPIQLIKLSHNVKPSGIYVHLRDHDIIILFGYRRYDIFRR